jgi:hypothetical protein
MGVNVLEEAHEFGIDLSQNATRGEIDFGNGGILRLCGNDSRQDRENMRGFGKNRRLVIIDEAQSQKDLKYLVREILEPSLIDCNGVLEMGGTPPRVKGEYFETEFDNINSTATRTSGNMFDNPFLQNAREQLGNILIERGLTENDPFIRREYFGERVYDIDALVFRFANHNYYSDAEFNEWLSIVPSSDIRAICGLDLGYEDANAVCTVIYATHNPMLWVIHEQTVRRQGLSDLVSMVSDAVAKGQQYSTGTVYVMADMGGLGKSIGMTLYTEYKLPMKPAEKQGKENAVEILGDVVRTGMLRVKKESLFVSDALKMVYARDEQDNLTRIIDDNVFHSDIADAVLYAVRAAKGFIRA